MVTVIFRQAHCKNAQGVYSRMPQTEIQWLADHGLWRRFRGIIALRVIRKAQLSIRVLDCEFTREIIMGIWRLAVAAVAAVGISLASAAQAADSKAPSDKDTYSENEIVKAASDFFGMTTEA